METTPMSYEVEITENDFNDHPLGVMWLDIPGTHPTYGSNDSFPLFLKEGYNIHMIDWSISRGMIRLIFNSEQDYTLWKLHQ